MLILSLARIPGHVVNPITLFWCHSRDGGLRCAVAEVHNTYGERHAYLLHTDETGTATTIAMGCYVSPFHPADGHHEMRLPSPGEHLRLSVRLQRPGSSPFTAPVHVTRREATAPSGCAWPCVIPGRTYGSSTSRRPSRGRGPCRPHRRACRHVSH